MKAIPVIAITFLAMMFLSGCTVNKYYGSPGGQQQYSQASQGQIGQGYAAPSQNYVQLTGGIPGKGHQPPVGFKTKRTLVARIGAFKINSWGLPGDPLNYAKPAAIQKWHCGSIITYNAFFESEAAAQAFMSSPDRDQKLSQWRSILDSTPPTPDPSRPGAEQVYMNL